MREHFDCSEDEAAIERANKFADECDVELWQGGRSVATIRQRLNGKVRIALLRFSAIGSDRAASCARERSHCPRPNRGLVGN